MSSTENGLGSWLNYHARHRARAFRGGIVVLGGVIVLALHHTATLDGSSTRNWLQLHSNEQPEWWPEESAVVNPQWGMTEDMGWQVNETLADLGEIAENAYARGLGFDRGIEGTNQYVYAMSELNTATSTA